MILFGEPKQQSKVKENRRLTNAVGMLMKTESHVVYLSFSRISRVPL